MADSKISALAALAAADVAAADVLPIVDTSLSTTKKVAVSDLQSAPNSALTASRPVFTDASKVLTSAGTVPVNQGGTGATSYTDGQLLIGNTTGNTLAKGTLTAGTGISVTAGAGSITIAATGATNPAALPHAIGVEWDQSADSWRYLDSGGNTITITQADFDRHPVWGGMRRVNMSVAGVVNAAIGDQGFSLTGSNGQVMVEVPRFYSKTYSPSANVYQWYVSDVPLPGYALHPAFKQTNGGSVTRAGNYLYVGAYQAGAEHNGTNLTLDSRTGNQPFCGGTIWSIPFGTGANEPSVGDDISTTEANMFIAAYKKTGGTWAGGDATGTLWVYKPNDDTNSTANPEAIVNNTKANTLGATTGTATALGLTIANARGYAQAIGTGWNVWNYYEHAALRLLYLIEYKGANAQTVIGQGIVNKAGGTGFAGELNGKDGIDALLAANGTGAGSGTDGLTPIAYRGIENFWGNVWQWTEGWNAVDGADPDNGVKYRLLKADGSSTFADSLATYDELAVTHTGLTGGWQSNLHFSAGFSLLFIPSAFAGGSTSHLFDYFSEHAKGQTNALFVGGSWADGSNAGPVCLNSNYGAGYSGRGVGARLSFLK